MQRILKLLSIPIRSHLLSENMRILIKFLTYLEIEEEIHRLLMWVVIRVVKIHDCSLHLATVGPLATSHLVRQRKWTDWILQETDENSVLTKCLGHKGRVHSLMNGIKNKRNQVKISDSKDLRYRFHMLFFTIIYTVNRKYNFITLKQLLLFF